MTAVSHDYIIVGAGSAGCVLAHRLTEDPDTTVLLLEAGGPDDKPEIHIPFALTKLLQSEVDWAYYTEAQAALNGRQIFWPRGQVWGGSSSINAMVYMRGHPAVYDGWAAAGNIGWDYASLLPYFKKSEHQERIRSEYHGTDGLLNVADPRDANPLSCAFLDAASELGLPRNEDFNGGAHEGFGFFQLTMKEGERWSTARAFLQPALKRPPRRASAQALTTLTHAHATQILFAGSRASGVAYLQDGQTQQAYANREIILCGGAINSPQLLLLSGIGPANHLRQMGIPVRVDLPGVGHNLQDHLDVPVAYECIEPISLSQSWAAAELAYRYFRKGPLACNGGEAGAFLKTQPDLPLPDLQFHFAPGWSVGFGVVRPQGHGFTFWPALLLPQSKGYLELKTADPLQHPRIQPNYLTHEAEFDVLIYGIKLARQLAQTEAFAPFIGAEIQPGTAVQSDDEMREYIRQSASTVFHPVGTCQMGVGKTAVVNPQLQVIGVEGLRVVDASVMPTIPNGNTNAPVIMIAEKAADLIQQAY
jgi:choline dehydrogenase